MRSFDGQERIPPHHPREVVQLVRIDFVSLSSCTYVYTLTFSPIERWEYLVEIDRNANRQTEAKNVPLKQTRFELIVNRHICLLVGYGLDWSRPDRCLFVIFFLLKHSAFALVCLMCRA